MSFVSMPAGSPIELCSCIPTWIFYVQGLLLVEHLSGEASDLIGPCRSGLGEGGVVRWSVRPVWEYGLDAGTTKTPLSQPGRQEGREGKTKLSTNVHTPASCNTHPP